MRALVVFAVTAFARVALASYPVFDATNFGKMLESVRLLKEEVRQLQATYRAVSGSRGLGDVLYNPALRQYLPEGWSGVYDAAAAGRYAGISGSLRDIERVERLTGSVAAQLALVRERPRRTAMTNKALGLRAFEGAKARLSQIESLMEQVNRTQDSKGVAEIQARIAVEQAAVANEATKLQLVAMLQGAEERLEAEQRRELARRLLSPASTGMPACCSAR
jgi:type IV secretion system protein VirB5